MNIPLKTLLALAIPLVSLLGMTIYYQHAVSAQPEFTLPIEGYDPTDFLSGNYIQFQLKYQVPRTCTIPTGPGYICLAPEQKFFSVKPEGLCEAWIEGTCVNGAFRDDIHRFYIPQTKAAELERDVRAGNAAVVLSVGQGGVLVKDLLINGKPWNKPRD
jgi:hypothetical protein